ncbi:non-ribosomal peptide synthetase [Pseudomonas tohonis]|uniref:non-ribosomal peptide synthetase n=1 Tax=Pseudomonas tohonis TaxID=2725477 RepID=UPI0021DA128C|nr:non-ribosomal peptide synthetase [Pseudomonas tohonis]UXY50549.1 amino acid adenylation domain-containing protein [Pseudomonas tohonis]
MQSHSLSALVERFIKLPAEPRKTLYRQMSDKGISLSRLPIPVTRGQFEHLPLSFAQERQWFLWELDPTSTAYNMPLALRLRGPLDRAALQHAFDGLVARHESLRTRFYEHDARRYQRIEAAAPLAIVDETLPPGTDLHRHLEALIDEPFDLLAGDLLRVRLIPLGEQDHILLLVQHHIISDAWSMQVMAQELVQLYSARQAGQPDALEPLPIQYGDYALWQRHWMEAGERDRQLGWWKAQLGAHHPVLELPTDRPRPAVQGSGGASLDVPLPAALARRLHALAQQENATPFMLLLASFQALLHRYSGQQEIRVGVPVANRQRAEVQRLIGFFVNTQVLNARFEENPGFRALLQQVRQLALGAQTHQDLPFEQLVEALQPERSLSHTPLFQVMYNHLQAERGTPAQGSAALLVEPVPREVRSAQFDLSLTTFESTEGLTATLVYATDLFEAATIERMAGHWLGLLEAIVTRPDAPIAELPLLSPAERETQLHGWNATATEYPLDTPVHQLIETQVQRTPDAPALAFGAETLSYAELNRRANRLAHALIARGVGPDSLVGIAVERSIEMVVGLLAILKAGGAYVPLDPEYPAERLAYMLDDSGVKLLLSQSHLELPLAEDVQRIDLDRAPFDDFPEANPGVALDAENLAYVIYTSGSTGKPKGAGNRHSALTNRLCWMQQAYGLAAGDSVLQKTPFSFDVSVWEFFWPLMTGARLVVAAPGDHRDPARLVALIERENITTLHFVPSMLQAFLLDPQVERCTSLKRIVCSGEALPVDAQQQVFARLPQAGLYNLYGPTEAAIDVTHWTCVDEGKDGVPIGQPIANLGCYILDANLEPVPVGVLGELYLAGKGLARGYHRRPALTAERFVANPFVAGERMYRTGDLARYRQDGVIEYAGRIDHQVKIRGLRIELGEIEARLMELDEVREAVVLAVDQRLVGYVVPATADLDTEQLASQLRNGLPDYMVPAQWVLLEAMPLSPNGKLERKALPQPDAVQSRKDYVEPQEGLERQLADIWQALLGVERVGRHDGFFELGGHSLLATQVVSRVRQQLQREVSLRTLFEHPQLSDFARAIERPLAQAEPPLLPVSREQPLPLSYAQERQWFLWQLEPESAAYHIPSALRLKGTLDIAALERAFSDLIARHESLRTHFGQQQDTTVQIIAAPYPLSIVVDHLAATASAESWLQAEISRPFDLRRGPLLRARLLRLDERDHILAVTLHHIVADGWSMQLMVEELVRLYHGHAQGLATSLPTLPIQYADYAAWQRQWMDAGERDRQLAYWTAQLGGEQPVLELPLDHPRPAVSRHLGARLHFEIPAELTARLKQLARQHDVTLFTLLLASFQTLLHRYSGQADIRIGVPIANRNRLETEGLIGFFVNTLVLRAELDGQMPLPALLKQARQALLTAQAHQDLPFEQLVTALSPERSLAHSPLFQVMYNHQTASGSERALPVIADLEVDAMGWSHHTAQFDLTLDTFERQGDDGTLQAILTYATDLFEAPTIERLTDHWRNLLAAMVANPARRIAELPMLSSTEQQANLLAWNPATAHFPVDACLHQLFEQRAAEAPDSIALSFEGQTLAYGELNRRANRIAHRLIAEGVRPDTLVGLAAGRGLEVIVGLLAILKAGGAYVPLDPAYPEDRLAYLIEDSGLQLLLAEDSARERLVIPAQVRVLPLEADSGEGRDDNPNVALSPANLAYVIYTSGSTGQPKGALLSHANALRLFTATDAWFGFGPQDVWSLFHSFAFDFSVWEIFGALLYGGRLVIVPQWVTRSPDEFHALLCREGVTVLNQTPSAFKALMGVACSASSQADALRYVVFGGEALEVKGLAPWFDRFGDTQPRLVNMYGITETTVHVTWRPLSKADLHQAANSPIGEAIPDLTWYLLDGALNPVAQGCTGELYVGGPGLARGYLKRPALSATRFVPDPFSKDGERLYRTGDLARYRSDGVIEYIGRLDQQVKIRGFRIELGEIEAQLLAHASIREAAVLAQDGNGGPQLVAYLVPGGDFDEASLREALKAHLREHLPDYMVPAHLLFLDQLPLTTNGKLDRKALPALDASVVQAAYVAPRNDLERGIADIWQDILKVARIGVTDNFFELGGDSIISIQVVSRARQAGILFTPKDLFLHQSVQELAAVARLGEAQVIDQGPVTGPLALLPIQQTFFDTDIPQRQHWNQAVLLRPTVTLQPARLEQALAALLVHHDALRQRFTQHNGAWQAQVLAPDALRPVLWHRQLATAAELPALADQAQRSLALESAELVRAVLVDLADGSQRLLLAIHHLAVDGVSWRILFEDLQTLYRQLDAGHTPTLPAKTSSTKAWAERLHGYAASTAGRAALPYWLAQLADAPVDLPCDNPHGSLRNSQARTLSSHLDQAATRRLLQIAPAAYRTQINDLLLTALARVVARWSGHPDVLVQLEGHGREDLFDDIDLTRTVGWFTSLFPVKLSVGDDLAGSIKGVKETLRALPDKGLSFGALRHLGEADTRQRLAALPTPRITFNYLGQFDNSFDDAEGALFVPAPEGSGQEQSEEAPLGNWLTLNGQIYGGELNIGWTFSQDMYDEATIARLAEAYSRELHALIEHCCSAGSRGATPSDFPLAGLTQAQLDRLPLDLAAIEDIYPLSPMQQGMLFHTLEASEAAYYINQMAVDVDGLDAERFVAAWNAVIARHEILRTGFCSESHLAQPLQVVYRSARLPATLLDWSQREVTPEALLALAEDEAARGFDLLQAPLMRLTLVTLGNGRAHLVWTSHHILMDGWSNSRLLGEVLETYNGLEPAPRRGRYRDYIAWLQAQPGEPLEAFWRQKLQALEGPTLLADHLAPRPDANGVGHQALYLHWDRDATQHLREQAQRLRVTPNTLIQAAWLLLLQRCTGQATVCFGATVAGRPTNLPGADEMLGLFINTLPIIQTPRPEHSVRQWLEQLQGYNVEVREREHTPLAELQRWSGQGGQALFDSIIVFENYPVDERLQEAEQEHLRFGKVNGRDVTNFAMDLAVHLEDTFSIEFLYLRNAFTEEAVQLIRSSFETLLRALLAQPDARIGSLPMLPPAEQALLEEQNHFLPSTAQPLLAEQIRRHALVQPEATAAVCAGHSLSYAELEQRATRLAAELSQRGIGPESIVGVALERSVDTLVAFYAVMKTGAAYVPLDIEHPAERLRWVVEDSAMRLLISKRPLCERFDGFWATPLLLLDEPLPARAADELPVHAEGSHLAYLIYTSGSTGKPKGVAVAHEAIRMHCQAIGELYEMTAQTRELLFMSFAFDGAQERWLTTLSHGGCLVIRDNRLWTAEETWQALHEQRIDIACFPPAYLQQLAEYAQAREQSPPPVRVYCFGGDAVAEANFERVKRALKPVTLTNGYGPTETVVTPMLWKTAASGTCGARYAPIGSRVGQRSLYVLDGHLNPVPRGVAGELYIGGEGLARGYHQRPGLTAERFVADPFSIGGRLYRTGDWVRQRADGVIDYLGRLDNQIKIRGFRIEPGEIEARLRALPGIQDAVVVAREVNGSQQLIGYVSGAAELQGDSLRAALQGELPEYMVPVHIAVLPALPLNANGKVDRNALPAPDLGLRTFVAPRNDTERALADIWQEVLEIERVGVTDNFFELGGDSLRILKVLSKLRARPELGLTLKLRDMIGKPTIAELSGYDEQAREPDPLLALNTPGQAGAALFCLHAGFGTVFDYEPLARRLEGRCSVHGIQCRMLLDRDWQDHSLEAMAIDYTRFIRRQQPEGPYRLLGWSLGGALALLVAQELERQGQEVEQVGLVDCFTPVGSHEDDGEGWERELSAFLATLLGVPADALPSTPLPPGSDSQAVRRWITEALEAAGGDVARSAITADELAQTFLAAMKLKHLSLAWRHVPRIAAPTACWWATQGRPAGEQRLLQGHFPAAGSHQAVAAGHYDILRHPALLDDLLEWVLDSEPVAG